MGGPCCAWHSKQRKTKGACQPHHGIKVVRGCLGAIRAAYTIPRLHRRNTRLLGRTPAVGQPLLLPTHLPACQPIPGHLKAACLRHFGDRLADLASGGAGTSNLVRRQRRLRTPRGGYFGLVTGSPAQAMVLSTRVAERHGISPVGRATDPQNPGGGEKFYSDFTDTAGAAASLQIEPSAQTSRSRLFSIARRRDQLPLRNGGAGGNRLVLAPRREKPWRAGQPLSRPRQGSHHAYRTPLQQPCTDATLSASACRLANPVLPYSTGGCCGSPP